MWIPGSFLDNEMMQVELKLKQALKTRNKTIEEAVLQLLNSGGKRLRPAFTVLGGTFGEYTREKVTAAAASMEIVHMATLVHDDIIDDAALRRGNETVQSQFGKDVAVYCGDFLFSRAFMLVSHMAEVELLKDIAKGVAFICDSEIMQNEQKFDKDATVRDYMKRIAGKTAALFAVSISAGAHVAGCNDKLTKKLGRIGRNIGMAFQIVDDLLDFTGDHKKVGKPLLNDAVQGIYTLPVIYALNSKHKEQTSKALEKLQEDKGEMLLNILNQTASIERTRKLAYKYLEKATAEAKSLPDTIGKQAIIDIINKQLDRSF